MDFESEFYQYVLMDFGAELHQYVLMDFESDFHQYVLMDVEAEFHQYHGCFRARKSEIKRFNKRSGASRKIYKQIARENYKFLNDFL